MLNPYRDPKEAFEAAIRKGVLSIDKDDDLYCANFMYMGDNLNGDMLFKNINTRSYLPPVSFGGF